MRKFHFSLEKILTLRCEKTRTLLEVYLKATRHLDTLKLTRDLVAKNIEGLQQEMRSLRASSFSPMEMQVVMNELAATQTKLSSIQDQMYWAASDQTQKRQEYLKAKSEQKALEKLKDKRLLEHTNEQLKEEAKFLDELVSIRYAR